MAWVIGIGIGIFLLFAFPKQTGGLILLLVLVGAGIYGVFYLQEQRQAEDIRKRKETITLAASYDLNRCSTEFPIFIEIRNGYTKTIESLSFDLRGYREGYSSPVYGNYSSYESDRIIAPGEAYTACWVLPNLETGAQAIPPEGLIWQASYSYANFKEKP